MSDDQHQFYMEQARLCERAAIDALTDHERALYMDGRDSWLALVDLVSPPVRFKWQRNSEKRADAES